MYYSARHHIFVVVAEMKNTSEGDSGTRNRAIPFPPEWEHKSERPSRLALPTQPPSGPGSSKSSSSSSTPESTSKNVPREGHRW
ncbi:uncharacterized protein LOC111271662 isoform X3 [Varroa jacobsoni]|uniref:uncharacterized protein LOC111271662 isoform X3 n=1 Tax=Varroa jacobsoni TaxID=62625 RepID=UPI000BF24FB5|nr:uncharacterized protein LOC111271662 isoform X3 [Varroa jacobsoni]